MKIYELSKQKKYRIAALFLLILASVAVIYLILIQIQKKEATAFYQEIAELYQETDQTEAQSQESLEKEESILADSEKLSIPVDIRELQKTMPDVYAWIEIPGTDIAYPVVQREDDNAYYLNRTPDGKSSIMGSIFSETYNKKDFTDPNTIFYGHNMKDGSMFGQLHRYEDRSFFDKNRTIYIYTEDNILEYKIFAAYLYDDRHILQSYDFSDPQILAQYLQEIYMIRDIRSYADSSVNVTETSKLLTLSTCHGMGDKYRYIVQAILLT